MSWVFSAVIPERGVLEKFAFAVNERNSWQLKNRMKLTLVISLMLTWILDELKRFFTL